MTFPAPSLTKLTRWQALGLITLVWAAIYLPALGTLEIKGEEGRRILPAVAMLDTGRWIVPQVGGVPYLSKPPLINWLVAAAFQLTGTRNEWTARAPSVLAVLALALVTAGALSRWLSPAGALLAAIFELTNIGLMEKGRLAEIEALYLSLYGVAFCLWLGAWHRAVVTNEGNPWRTWVLPWLFLGLGLLAKGPLHLLFFYGVVVAILCCAGRTRDLWNLPHLVGVILMLAIFGAWAWPYLRQTAAGGAGSVWLAQFQGRLEVNETFHLTNWLLNIPFGLRNYLPWAVLLPLVWRPVHRASRSVEPTTVIAAHFDAAVLRGLLWGAGGCFLVVSLAPGGQPRYTLPLLVPASIMLACVLAPGGRNDSPLPTTPLCAWLPLAWRQTVMACLWLAMAGAVGAGVVGGSALPWRWALALGVIVAGGSALHCLHRWELFRGSTGLALASAVTMALLTADYVLGATYRLRRAETVRPVGRQIERIVGPATPVMVLRPGFVPFLFYVQHLDYLQDLASLSVSTAYLLVREEELENVRRALNAREVGVRVVFAARDKRVKDEHHNHWDLLQLQPAARPSL